MAETLTFRTLFQYTLEQIGITIPVRLQWGGKHAVFTAKVGGIARPTGIAPERNPMALQEPTFEEALQLAKQLTPAQKLRLISAIAPDLEEPLRQVEGGQQPLQSLYGLWKDFGVNISAEEIDAARREMGGSFPRDDI